MKTRTPKRLLAVLLSVLVVVEILVSAIMGTVAEDLTPTNKEVTKQLIDFSEMSVATDIADSAWPNGISKMDENINNAKFKYGVDTDYTVDIAEDTDGKKILKFNFDSITDTESDQYLQDRTARTGDIYVKVAVPYWYINYLKDIQLDYVYNYNKGTSTTNNKFKAFYILGISNGTDKMGKSNDGASNNYKDVINKSASVQRATVKKDITDLFVVSGSSNLKRFDKNIKFNSGSAKWKREELANESKMDVILMFSAPQIANADKTKGYYFGIKGINVTLEGPTEDIDNVDNVDYVNPQLLNFEEGTTLDEVETNTANTVKFGVSAGSDLSADAVKGNALFYAANKSANTVQYDSNMTFSLKRSVTRSKGITFMAKNLGSKEIKFRIWIAVGNDTGSNANLGKYQAFVTIPANQTEYKRYSIYWNDVGLMSFTNSGQWWGGTASGNTITTDELASGLRLSFKYPANVVPEDVGVLFDEFEYITKKFTDDRTVTVLDFSNCEIGGELPENVTIGGNYEGSTEIIQNVDGTKSLKLNYDAPAAADTKSEMHHLRSRLYSIVKVTVPRGSMADIATVAFDMTNNATGYDERRAAYEAAEALREPDAKKRKSFSYSPDAILYNIGIGDSTEGRFGKSSEVNSTMRAFGNLVDIQKPNGMLSAAEYTMTAWVNSDPSKGTVVRWTAEELKNIDTFYFYIGAPDCNGTEGMSFQLNSITVTYNEPSEYKEEQVREIVHSDKVASLASGKISANQIVVGTTDPNNTEFQSAVEVKVNSADNTERLVFKNELSEYYRNLTPFYDKGTAKFHMFAFADKDLEFKASLIDKNGAELTTNISVKAATTKLYSEASADIKEVYDAAIAADPAFTFDMSDIRAIALLPIVTESTSFKVAGVTVLTGNYVSSATDNEKQKFVNLVNFDNCTVGTKGEDVELPTNVKVSGYKGSQEIVRTADGSNALQINYDAIAENERSGESHQTNKRTNMLVEVDVPVGSLVGLKKINVTMTNNCYKLSEQTDNYKRNQYTLALTTSDGVFVKQGESAGRFSGQKGVPSTISLTPEKALAGEGAYFITSWFNQKNAITLTEEHYKKFETLKLYVSVPDIDSSMVQKGYNFQINSIDLEFETKPDYKAEESTRQIVSSDNRELISTNKDTLTVKTVDLASNNINYRQFNKYYTVTGKAGNTAPAIITNSLSKFWRSAEPFVETSNFRLYYQVAKNTKAKISLVNMNGEKLDYEAELKASKSDKFDELVFTLKDVYNAFKTANPDGKFALNDITHIEVLPLDSTAVNVASMGLWSKEPGSAGSPGNYYYALPDDSVRVEAYDYNIAEDFTVQVQKLDPDETFAEFGTKLPKGAKALQVVKITLRNGNGEMVQPTGRFWVSIRLPEVDLTNVKMYEVFYDGSLLAIKHVVMDANNYISCEDYFATKTYAIMIVPPEEEELPVEDLGLAEDLTENEEIYEETVIEEEPSEEEEEQIIIRRRRRKKKSDADMTWLWILIAVIAVVVVVATGLVIFFIIRKKRQNGKGM